jgi:hypothetical protein
MLKTMQPRRYQVMVEGELGPRYAAAFEPHQLESAGGNTTITGTIRDQAELQGLIDAVSARGLSLISVTPLD